jgi:hypothetical protein
MQDLSKQTFPGWITSSTGDLLVDPLLYTLNHDFTEYISY